MALAVLLVSEGSDSSLVQANRAYAIEAKRCNPIIPLENVCKTVFFFLKKKLHSGAKKVLVKCRVEEPDRILNVAFGELRILFQFTFLSRN